MTTLEFWREVYLSAIRTGKPTWEAKAAADEAVRSQPESGKK